MSIKTSGDFDNDPEGALDALSKTGFALFMITKHWYDDERAVKEWRFAKDLNKPTIYILEKGVEFNKYLLEANVIGMVVIEKDKLEDATEYIRAMIAAYCHINDIKL